MANGSRTARFSLIMAVVCFGVAAVPLLGLILRDDPLGRLIFIVAWTFIGFVWIGHYRRAKKSEDV